MTPRSRPVTRRVHLFGRPGLAVLAGLVLLHMVSCLPGLHEASASGSGGHHLSVPAHLVLSATAADCRTGQADAPGFSSAQEGSGHRHVSCADAGGLAWLDSGTRSFDMALAATAAAVLLWFSGAWRRVFGCRGSPAAEKLPVGYWIRHRLRGAMLPAALGVSRT